MNQEELRYFKNLLQQRLQELLQEAEKTVQDMSDNGTFFPDPADRASAETDRSFLLRIRERERKLIGKIREALERIESGTFGICESCGDDIDIERLKARPVTTLCIECKRRQEAMEKVRGE